ncbi:hypothetical protein Fmac_015680 [Flemingia macrophylla]|uniref:Kunitz inhibitor ST1-like n=1 Tax=Flemingia macrophylla TaxID=520843 RepID=A0ABD1MF90_9FABA
MKGEQLVTLSLLLFAFPLAFSGEVLDAFGKPVLASGKYYILPALSGLRSGGGLSPVERDETYKCPVVVFQDLSRVKRGMPLKFSVLGKSDGIVYEGSQLEISFVDKPGCATSSNLVGVGDDFPLKWIGIGSAKDHPGKKVFNGYFKLEKQYKGYQLLFCPANVITCFNVARTQDQLGYRLVLTNGRYAVTPVPFQLYYVTFLPA